MAIFSFASTSSKNPEAKRTIKLAKRGDAQACFLVGFNKAVSSLIHVDVLFYKKYENWLYERGIFSNVPGNPIEWLKKADVGHSDDADILRDYWKITWSENISEKRNALKNFKQMYERKQDDTSLENYLKMIELMDTIMQINGATAKEKSDNIKDYVSLCDQMAVNGSLERYNSLIFTLQDYPNLGHFATNFCRHIQEERTIDPSCIFVARRANAQDYYTAGLIAIHPGDTNFTKEFGIRCLEKSSRFVEISGEYFAGGALALGSFYEDGRGTLQDFTKAYAWYNIAAISSNIGAQERDKISPYLTPSEMQSALHFCREWVQKNRQN